MAACTGSSRPQATPDQIERIITTVDLHPNLPNCLLPRRRCSLAGTAVAAAADAGRWCAPSPALSLPQPSTGIDPLGPAGPFPRPRPAGHGRRLAGFWPDRRRPAPEHPIASPQNFPGVHLRNKGISVTLWKILGVCLKVCSEIVFDLLQKLVKCVEIRRKFRKLQNKFCWICGENNITFVILTWSDSGYF
jgi:hypothetical protein